MKLLLPLILISMPAFCEPTSGSVHDAWSDWIIKQNESTNSLEDEVAQNSEEAAREATEE